MMESREIENKLTDAAKQSLDSIVADYRNEILSRAGESATNLTGDLHEVSVHDIIEGSRFSGKSSIGQIPSPIGRAFRLYFYLGFVVFFIGAIWFLAERFLPTLSIEEIQPIVLATFGLLMSGVSFLFLQLRKPDKTREIKLDDLGTKDSRGYSTEIVRYWKNIELQLRNLTATKLGESKAKEPVSVMVRLLVRSGTLNKTESKIIAHLLDLRNQVVHESIDINESEYRALRSDARHIIKRLRRSQ